MRKKKYELTEEIREVNGHVLYRIKAVCSFRFVKKGQLGGFIESEKNLSHQGAAWVLGNACVYGNAKVFSDAWVCGDACVYGDVYVLDNACVHGNAKIYGNAEIYDNAKICGNAEIYGNAKICGNAEIYDNANVHGNAEIYDNAKIYGNANVYGNAEICVDAEIFKKSHFIVMGPFGSRSDMVTFFRNKNQGVSVKCGYFYGKIDDFIKQVNETHGDSKYGIVYRAVVEVSRIQIESAD